MTYIPLRSNKHVIHKKLSLAVKCLVNNSFAFILTCKDIVSWHIVELSFTILHQKIKISVKLCVRNW